MRVRNLLVLLAVLLMLSFSGCEAVQTTAVPGDTILGSWKDNCGLTAYQFEQDGKMKLEALNLGSFQGTYQIDGDKITIEYKILVKNVKDTYKFHLDGNTMYLNDTCFSRKK